MPSRIPPLPPSAAELDRILDRQGQIVARRQLLAAGITDMEIYRRILRGRWQRVLPGVYAVTNGFLTGEQRRIGAALYAGPDAQLTGLSALAYYGFRYAPETDRVHLLVAHHTRRRSVGYVVVRRTHELDLWARDCGLYKVCSPARAVVDACRELTDIRTVRAVLAESVQRGFVSLHSLEAEVRRAARSRTALVRLALREVTDGVRSAPEADLRAALLASKILPKIAWNPPLKAPDGTPLPVPDGWIEDARLALEVDSREYHISPEDWSRTIERHNLFAEYEIQVLHFTPQQIRSDPGGVRRKVERAYLARTSAGLRG